jgi:agmatine deiminase
MKPPSETPFSLGYHLPAEWEKHEATWLGWPHHPKDWPGKLDTIQLVYGEITRKLAVGEKVRIFVNSRNMESKAHQILIKAHTNMANVEFVRFLTNRGWTRDYGAIFVKRKSSLTPALSQRERGHGNIAISKFRFNAWAKYSDFKKDNAIPEKIAKKYGFKIFHAEYNGRPIVLEGGGIDSNGRGTLLTTEECFLDQKTQARNPGLHKKEMNQVLKDYLGVTNVLWLGKGIEGDDTHGHVDDICRFVNHKTVVLIQEKNPKDVNYKPLQENKERLQGMRLENGSKINVVYLPMPEPLYYNRMRLPASYANFYIGNGAVIVPTFNDPNDRIALGILSELFTDRPVVGIHAVDLVLGFGTLHCLTHEQPDS